MDATFYRAQEKLCRFLGTKNSSMKFKVFYLKTIFGKYDLNNSTCFSGRRIDQGAGVRNNPIHFVFKCPSNNYVCLCIRFGETLVIILFR